MAEYIKLDELMEIAMQQGHVSMDDILNCTAADVAPVVHGRWDGYVCSVCGVSSEYGSENYCPSCGAIMDGGKNNAAD